MCDQTMFMSAIVKRVLVNFGQEQHSNFQLFQCVHVCVCTRVHGTNAFKRTTTSFNNFTQYLASNTNFKASLQRLHMHGQYPKTPHHFNFLRAFFIWRNKGHSFKGTTGFTLICESSMISDPLVHHWLAQVTV